MGNVNDNLIFKNKFALHTRILQLGVIPSRKLSRDFKRNEHYEYFNNNLIHIIIYYHVKRCKKMCWSLCRGTVSCRAFSAPSCVSVGGRKSTRCLYTNKAAPGYECEIFHVEFSTDTCYIHFKTIISRWIFHTRNTS